MLMFKVIQLSFLYQAGVELTCRSFFLNELTLDRKIFFLSTADYQVKHKVTFCAGAEYMTVFFSSALYNTAKRTSFRFSGRMKDKSVKSGTDTNKRSACEKEN